MARHCSGCGAELFGGQRFCRVCGRPTADLEGHDSPTQVMPPSVVAPEGSSQYGDRGSTGPTHGVTAPTGPVPQYMHTNYRPAPPAQYYQPPPPKGGARWGWVIAFIGIGLFAVVVAVVLMAGRAVRRARDQARHGEFAGVSRVDRSRSSSDKDFGVGTAPAITSAGTVIKQTFPLDSDATFSVANVSGDITVEAWDQEQAEVTITKTGNTPEMRDLAKVVYNGDEDKLNLKVLSGAPNGVSVKFDIKVPRNLEQLTIHSVDGAIRITGVENKVTGETTSGSIHLLDLKGGATAKTVSGSIDATFDSVDDDDPLDFSSVSGSISLQFKSQLDADLQAGSVSGNISLDPDFGVNVNKKIVGQEASGSIGDGGRPLRIKTVSGGISVTK